MDVLNAKTKKDKFTRFLIGQTIVISLILTGETIFFFFEQNYFNTYLDHVLNMPELAISLMVSLSAIMGLITNLSWGIVSDNTRSNFGRRRPFILFGGVIAGIFMILFGFSNNYILCLVIDVVIIGIASNAYIVAERSLVPDIIPPKLRGRANGYVNSIGNMGMILAVVVFFIANELFAVPDPRPGETGNIIPQFGYQFLFSFGGFFIIVCAVLGFLLIKEKSLENFPPRKSFLTDLRETVKINELRNNKEFFKHTLAYTIFRSGVMTIMPFLFLFIFEAGLGTLELGFAIIIAFPTLIGTMILLGKVSDKYGRKKYTPLVLIITSVGVFIGAFSLMGTQVNLLLFLIALPFILLAVQGLVVPLNAWSQDLLPEEKRGQFLGFTNIVFAGAQVVGVWIGGVVATYIGLQWIFAFAPIFFLLSIPFFLKVKETLVPIKNSE